MEKIFITIFLLSCTLLFCEVKAQTLAPAKNDSIAEKPVESENLKDTSFHCRFSRDLSQMSPTIVYLGIRRRSGFKNQNMRLISNRDFRNLNMGNSINAYDFF